MAGNLFKVTQGITYRGWPRGWRKQFRATNQEQLVVLGAHWHKRIFPERFTQRGARELRFAFRGPGYQAKKKEAGENVPLVGPRTSETSGTLRRESTGQARITATPTRLRVRFSAPAHALRSRGQATKTGHILPNIRDELGRVSPGHLRRMARVHDRNMTMQFNRLKTRETVVVK